MTGLLWPVLATCTVCAAVSAGAHEGATGVVAERMAAMKETAAHMKAMDRALKAGSSVTPDMVAGSGSGHSDARAEVWTRREAFEKAMQAFAADSEKLVSAARSGDYTETRRQFREVANQCLGCHDKFRAKGH
jgi:cytochrome c556